MSNKYRTIRVSGEVYENLKKLKENENESPNSVLSRLLDVKIKPRKKGPWYSE